MREINERVALEISVRLLIDLIDNFPDNIRDGCTGCDGKRCVEEYSTAYFAFDDRYFEKYMIYSMRHRTFGPHHFTAILDSLVFAACHRERLAIQQR